MQPCPLGTQASGKGRVSCPLETPAPASMGGSASWTTGCPPWEAQLPGPQAAPHGRLGFLDHRQGGETSQPAQTLAMPSSSLVWAAAEAASQVLVSRPSTLSISLSRLENLINGW